MNTVINDNVADTISVTDTLRNSHCIICGKPFDSLRMGKRYCSTKCKQFGYNHKDKINRTDSISGINATPQTFYIDDYQSYSKRQKMLFRYKELSNKQAKWELAECEIISCNHANINADTYTWNTYVAKRLTDNESSELEDLQSEIEDEITQLSLRDLSIEQWSFIKALNPSFDDLSFCQLVNSLSKDFYSQLTLSPTDRNNNENVVIKNKYINHCNLIATGIVKFEKKPVSDENEN